MEKNKRIVVFVHSLFLYNFIIAWCSYGFSYIWRVQLGRHHCKIRASYHSGVADCFVFVKYHFDRSYFILKKEVIKIVLFIACTIVSIIHTPMFTFGALMLCADFTSIKKLARTSALAIFWCTVIGIVACFRYAYVNDIIIDRFGRQRHYFAFGHYAVWARQMLYAGILYFVSK